MSKQKRNKIMENLNAQQLEKAKSLVGTDLTDYEYAHNIVIEKGVYYFNLVHLNGKERLVLVTDFI